MPGQIYDGGNDSNYVCMAGRRFGSILNILSYSRWSPCGPVVRVWIGTAAASARDAEWWCLGWSNWQILFRTAEVLPVPELEKETRLLKYCE